jgi:tRNA pseudouridine55 synthase
MHRESGFKCDQRINFEKGRRAVIKMNLDGILLFNKRSGITSHQALDELRKVLKIRRMGHCGTLDNFASGLLLVCLGKALKIVNFLENLDKEYLTKIRLGVSTDTYDFQGKILSSLSNFDLDESRVRKVVESFRGQIWQAPPPYSALKFQGKRLSDYARAGTPITKEPRKVKINSIEILKFFLPFVDLKICCSKGTYIRSLAQDIGSRLKCGAHLSSLTRTRIGSFKLQDAVELEKIKLYSLSELQERLVSVEEALNSLPAIKVTDKLASSIRNGPDLRFNDIVSLEKEFLTGDTICLKDCLDKVLALGKALRPSVELSQAGKKEKLIEYIRVLSK